MPQAASSELKRLLEQAQADYDADLENLIDAATDEIEIAMSRGEDPRDTINEYVRDASQLADDYYQLQRELWKEYGGADLEDYATGGIIEPERVLWEQQGGFANTDFNGLTYEQVMSGQSHTGLTIDDLWPDLGNIDDVQQLIADMISTSGRLTMRRNIDGDPNGPRWARICHGRPTPCAFCVMLASRGFVYRSKDTAKLGGNFHDGHCHCTVMVSWGADETILNRQAEWKQMYEAALASTGGDTDGDAITVAMNHLYPDKVSGGVYDLSAEWPDDVIRPYASVWEHIFDGHGPGTRVQGKTHFPDDWSEEKVKYAVKETVAAPDIVEVKDDRRKYYYKEVDGQVIRVWLQIFRSSKNRYVINTAHPITDQQRNRLK